MKTFAYRECRGSPPCSDCASVLDSYRSVFDTAAEAAAGNRGAYKAETGRMDECGTDEISAYLTYRYPAATPEAEIMREKQRMNRGWRFFFGELFRTGGKPVKTALF